eukprot:gnl/MRDRNA2_/MRDRNA2_116326_c0_seq1.p1 gnl/MRDRNA2_/MRDRNA2_116326_c0~~gnl/MRDRNA2_/MRDRNA2_116326_c0_seq1.p1  ORF type:complete len:239 (+),score=27.98 gnl/MRDRNA2_/MRDRNA2_116326_c0_seq1:136-852(+)
MLPFQPFSAAVWPVLVVVVFIPFADATRARGILKNAKTIRRIVHVSRHNNSGPIPSFEFGEDEYMMANFKIPPAKDLGCHPRCVWHCTDPVCDKTCEPVCEAPKCETRCPKGIDKKFCSQTCNEPDCLVTCKKENWEKLCPSQDCPNPCEIQCKEPECKMKCEAPVCHSLCEDPHCEWTCKDPEKCPKPQCQMQCEQPKGCLAGSVIKPLPPIVDTYVKTQAVAKVEGVEPLQDAKAK